MLGFDFTQFIYLFLTNGFFFSCQDFINNLGPSKTPGKTPTIFSCLALPTLSYASGFQFQYISLNVV